MFILYKIYLVTVRNYSFIDMVVSHLTTQTLGLEICFKLQTIQIVALLILLEMNYRFHREMPPSSGMPHKRCEYFFNSEWCHPPNLAI